MVASLPLAVKTTKVATVILSWRDPAAALRCAASIAAGMRTPEFPIIVENEAATGHAPALRAGSPESRVVEVAENLGYAGGMNAGIRKALELGADHIVLVNNDAEFERETLGRLVAGAERRPDAALFGAAQRLPDGSVNGPFFHFRWSDGRVELEPKRPEREEPFLAGCAVLVRAAALERLGLLDERFFIYCEDVEWSMRARRLGIGVEGARDALVRHELSASSGGGDSPAVLYYNARNRFLLGRYAPPRWRYGAYQAGHIARSVGQARRRARRGDAKAARAILAGLWAGLRRRYGRGMLEPGLPARAVARLIGAGRPASP